MCHLFKGDSPTWLITYENVKIYKILTEPFLIFRNRLDTLTYCPSVCMSTPPHLYLHRDLPLYLERLLWWPINTEHCSKQYPYFIYLTMDMDLYYGSPLYLKSVSGSEWSERKNKIFTYRGGCRVFSTKYNYLPQHCCEDIRWCKPFKELTSCENIIIWRKIF